MFRDFNWDFNMPVAYNFKKITVVPTALVSHLS